MAETVIEVRTESVVVVNDCQADVVSLGIQGPAGAQGPAGPPGPPSGGQYVYTAAIPLGGHRVLTLNAAGQAIYADAGTLAHMNRIVGMSTGAAIAGAPITSQLVGEFTEGSWNWTLDVPIYLGTNGHLTQVQPTSPGSLFSLVVAFPISATRIFLNPREPILIV